MPVKNIAYIVNWVQASPPADTVNKRGVTNGLKIDVTEKGDPSRIISSFIYDNTLLSFILKNEIEKMIEYLLI